MRDLQKIAGAQMQEMMYEVTERTRSDQKALDVFKRIAKAHPEWVDAAFHIAGLELLQHQPSQTRCARVRNAVAYQRGFEVSVGKSVAGMARLQEIDLDAITLQEAERLRRAR